MSRLERFRLTQEHLRGALLGAGIVLAPMLVAADHAGQPGRDLDGCLVPSPEALQAAQNLLDAPEDPMVTRFSANFGKGDSVEPISQEGFDAWRVQKAAENELTIHPFKDRELSPDVTGEKLIAARRQQAEAFLGQYGITLSFGDEFGKLWGMDGNPLTPEQRRDPKMAEAYFSIQNFVSRYPVEFLQQTGQREIVLMDGRVTDVGDTIDRKVAGQVSPAHPHTIYLDYKYPEVIDHELAHQVTNRMGCMTTPDPNFVTLNQNNTYGPPNENTAPTLEDYQFKTQRGQPVAPDYKKKLVYPTRYARTNHVEETAELGKNILNPSFGNYDDKTGSILEEKFVYELARYYTIDPKATRFFAQTSYRAAGRQVTSVK